MNVQEIGCILFLGLFLGAVVGWVIGSRAAKYQPPLTNGTNVIETICAFIGALIGIAIAAVMCL